jgi:hypothetical protein
MVGAMLLGEFAWSIENLSTALSPDIDPHARNEWRCCGDQCALPQLVEQLESGQAPEADVAAIMGRAHAYAEGRDPEQVAVTATAPEDVGLTTETFSDSVPRRTPAAPAAAREAPRPTSPAQPAMDPVLHDIYRRESAGSRDPA